MQVWEIEKYQKLRVDALVDALVDDELLEELSVEQLRRTL